MRRTVQLLLSLLAAAACLAAAQPQTAVGTRVPFCIPFLSWGRCRTATSLPSTASPDASAMQLWRDAAPDPPPAAAAAATPSPLVKALEGAVEAASLSSRCKAGTWNTSTNSCTCAPGWTGQGCITCTGDRPQVCPGVTGDPSSTCSTTMDFTPSTQYKAYSCSMAGGFALLVSGITGMCSITGAAPPGWVNGVLGWSSALGRPPQTSWCQLQVEVVGSPSNPLQCSLSDCSFPAASSSFTCSKANCSCPEPGGCAGALSTFASSIGASPLTFSCSANGDCSLKGVMQLELQAHCRAGECTQPRRVAAAGLLSSPAGVASSTPSESTPAVPATTSSSKKPLEPHAALAAVVGAAPLALLLMLAAGGAAYVWRMRAYLQPCSKQPAAGGGQGTGHLASQQEGLQAAKGPVLVTNQQHLQPRLSEQMLKTQPSLSVGGCTGQPLPCEVEGLPVELVFDKVSCLLPGAGRREGGGARRQGANPGAAPGWWGKLCSLARKRHVIVSGQGSSSPSTPGDQRGTNSDDSSCSSSSSTPRIASIIHVHPGANSRPDSPVTSSATTAAAGSSGTGATSMPGQTILSSISGRAAAGQVLGIMGPSGSGKSTLLCILSGSRELLGAGSVVTGRVTLGGEARRSALRKVTAFVPQKDVLLPSLTVEECVRYSALLRLPLDTPAATVQERISRVLQELHLTHVAPSLVGGTPSIRGVSGGERRRVTIAMELVTLPRCLLMDEPTSGLDSFTAYQLMQAARELAAAGRVVVMSLHQPSPDMFQQLDKVLLLAKGKLAYLGPPAQVNSYLAAAGVGGSLPDMAPAEKLLHVASQQHCLDKLLCLQQDGTGGASGSTASSRTTSGSSTHAYMNSTPQVPSPSVAAAAAAVGVSDVPDSDPEQPRVVPQGSGRTTTAPYLMWQAAAMAICSSADNSCRKDSAMQAGPVEGEYSLATTNASSSSSSAAGEHLCVELGSEESTKQQVGPEVIPEVTAAQQSQQHQQQPEGLASQATHTSATSRADSTQQQRDWPGHMWPAGLWAACKRAGHAFSLLLWRCFKDLWRSPGMLLLHSSVAVLMGLMVGLVFFRLDSTNVGVQNRLGSMFFALALLGFCSISIIDSLVLERELVTREVHARYYGSGPYLAAKLVLDGLLLRGLPAVLFTVLMYPLVGLSGEAYKAATFVFVLATYAATVGALAVALTAVCRSAAATSLTLNLLLLLWVLIGGYLVNPTSMPVWLRWVRWLCPMSYAFEAMASNELTGQVYALRVDGFPNLEGIAGEVLLSTLGLVPGRTLQNVGILVAFYVGSVLLATAAVRASLQHQGGKMLPPRRLLQVMGRV